MNIDLFELIMNRHQKIKEGDFEKSESLINITQDLLKSINDIYGNEEELTLTGSKYMEGETCKVEFLDIHIAHLRNLITEHCQCLYNDLSQIFIFNEMKKLKEKENE